MTPNSNFALLLESEFVTFPGQAKQCLNAIDQQFAIA